MPIYLRHRFVSCFYDIVLCAALEDFAILSACQSIKNLMSQYNTQKDPCKASACKIQACLKENNYQEDKCLEVLEQMRQCCLKWHKQSLCCSGIILERSYIKGKSIAEKETVKEKH